MKRVLDAATPTPAAASVGWSVLDLVRPDLRGFAGYASARRGTARGSVWLNANESPWPDAARLNRYPEPQPAALCDALAALYGSTPERVLVGRGSDEAIDLLVRALCRPGRDAVVVTPPVFGMYAVSARLQGAPLVEVPLVDRPAAEQSRPGRIAPTRVDGSHADVDADDAGRRLADVHTAAGDADGWRLDVDAVARAALANAATLVFVCSPGNPTGQACTPDDIARLAAQLAGRALLVVDEAYGEYSDPPSAVALMDEHANLAVLRTLSKAHGLAAARIGTLIAPAALIPVLRNCQAPYPLPAPCVELALAALAPDALARTSARVQAVREERARLQAALAALPGVRRVYPSQGNFLLVRFADAQRAFERLLARGVVVRDMRAAPALPDALRISIGTREENDAVLEALS